MADRDQTGATAQVSSERAPMAHADRFQWSAPEQSMKAVVTTGIGGYERLEYQDVARPRPGPGEVVLQVLTAGVNNTDINTRVGWYGPAASGATDSIASKAARDAAQPAPGGWRGVTPFPLIQGTDCCGRVVAVAEGEQRHTMGSRVLVRPCMPVPGGEALDTVWMGSDFDGAFAQLVKVPSSEAFAVRCDWSDAELGSIPCAYGTAENLLLRARPSRGEHILVTGASGGVGTAVVQLAKRRGAMVTAVAAGSKSAPLLLLGADRVLGRDADPLTSLGPDSVDVVIDNVGGPAFPSLLGVLRRGGRYLTSGAIAGPVVGLDLRTVYLKDLVLTGCTAWDQAVFPNLIKYIESGEIRPVVAKTFALAHIAEAQREFLEKKVFGKLVLIPPAIDL